MSTADKIALAGVIVSALTPIALIAVGYWVDRRLKHFERTIEREQRIAEVRLDLYKDIGFKLNDLFAYFCLLVCGRSLVATTSLSESVNSTGTSIRIDRFSPKSFLRDISISPARHL